MAVEPLLTPGALFKELHRYRRWVPHQNKEPRQASNRHIHARVDDPQTWGSYARARRTAGMSGLGFMLMDLNHIVVADLDSFRKPVI